jgi:hypothetical protein
MAIIECCSGLSEIDRYWCRQLYIILGTSYEDGRKAGKEDAIADREEDDRQQRKRDNGEEEEEEEEKEDEDVQKLREDLQEMVSKFE